MNDYCVIGSGISGATISNLLNKKSLVHSYDKGRGPGGRASFKRVKGKVGFDHGTQYFSPKSKEFKRFVNKLVNILLIKTIFVIFYFLFFYFCLITLIIDVTKKLLSINLFQ